MGADNPVKALLIAIGDELAPAIYTVNRLQPENLCFVLTESAKTAVQAHLQPQIQRMPRRWDWLVVPDLHRLAGCQQTLARALPDLLRTWEIQAGELVVDLTAATPALGVALALVAGPYSSRLIMLQPPEWLQPGDGEGVRIDGGERIWLQVNPWDEGAGLVRRDACDLFNRGAHAAAGLVFRQLEARVSGGQKPLYRALAELSDGYDLWERFQYRQGWEKLKSALKALEMAAIWGGPPGLKGLLPPIKQNVQFLEKLVLDPLEVKEAQTVDLLAHARRRASVDHDWEAAVQTVLRALEAAAQLQLFKRYRIKTWDVQPEQLPEALREPCRSCWLDDVDGRYKLPLYAQFRALAGLGDEMGQAYLAQWAKMKPLLDAASQAVLGHGFESVKAERYHQLYEVVLRITTIPDAALPKFPVMIL